MSEDFKKPMSEKVRLLYIWMLGTEDVNYARPGGPYVYTEPLSTRPWASYCAPTTLGLCQQVAKSL